LINQQSFSKERPSLIITKQEAAEIKSVLGKYPLLDRSYENMKKSVDSALLKRIEVPPPGEAGGYEHERHKQNYTEMHHAGILFTITGDEKYARFVRDLLLQYAKLYPTLGKHPQSHDQAPGKLFHQMLNETVWLTYTSMAYDCIYDWLDQSTRDKIEQNVFRIIIDWFITENQHEFNRIHNHGTWTVCSVGLIGYVLGDQNLVDMALYGTEKDGNGGFLKQLDRLFSPDGYYMEGPYYARYALRPFFLFAEAIERNQPDLQIYDYRNQILKKAYYSAVQTTFPNGVFPPINDASRTMDIQDIGLVLANSLVYSRYGADPNLLAVAKIQNEVLVNGAGLKLAQDFSNTENIPAMDWGSIEFTDGYDGEQGGLGILRMGTGEDQSMLLMKYGVHGEGHGHFDKLHFIFFDQGREVIPDYGFCRWINIEPKFGGRYLPENKSYAMQTIAHNTVTVDQNCQNNFNRKQADSMSGKRHFFDASDPNVQVISARADGYFPDVNMQRTMFLIKDERLEYPVILDLYRVTSDKIHTYDYPIHHHGQLITTNFQYEANSNSQQPLGDNYGYQHIWNEAVAKTDESPKITWLDGNRYYSLISAAATNTEIFFGRTGANDPNFNLISEPMFIIRRQAKDHLFATAIEPHGYFNEGREQSDNARGNLLDVKVIGHDDTGSVIEVTGKNDLHWRIMVTNGKASKTEKHSVVFEGNKYFWVGNFEVELEAK
jgi:hypothetical protein